ncbi:MAG: methionine synthase [Spirochaetales bacterium]|nr:methionine synthase [Spirochaetales bacterium]
MKQNELLTTTVGSYPVPDWLKAYPTETALRDAIRVIVATQTQAGIELPTDGELYRFDVNHPETNGMIEYFVNPLGGIRPADGWEDWKEFRKKTSMAFRTKPAGVVVGKVEPGALNLPSACKRTTDVAGKNVKFTITSPYMLARTLHDTFYDTPAELTLAIAEALASQISDLDCACVQIDEANIPGNPADVPVAVAAINILLDRIQNEAAVHLCFGNYGGQTVQDGTWANLIAFLNSLHCNHVIMEVAHRPDDDLEALRGIESRIGIGIGVVDIKVNHIETPEQIARRIESAMNVLGRDRIKWVHPDCGFWMLNRTIVDKKIKNLVKGRDLFLGIKG